ILDIAKRINAGTGSLGAPRYYILIAGNPKKSGQERILDLKSQAKPITYDYMAEGDRHRYDQCFKDNHALRHATAYRALTNNTDDYLGWMELELPGHRNRYFSVRELSPYKKAFNTSKFTKVKDFETVAKTWGTILATAHARSDKDFDDRFVSYSFDKQIDQITDGHHKEFRQLVRAIAFEYADQVHTDWEQFINSSLVKS
ncbi:MAG: DUF2252 domain-containing protein, partial [Merismopedia sp. SIO2A8]|nr:DUF2252 domain-containing protein [Merismopedia sp. SIO2A8]